MSADTGTRGAGRELDALVAEKVMGWVAERFEHAGRDGQYFRVPDSSRVWRIGGWPSEYENDELPAFSTDIAAAWLVVEKMREREPHPWMVSLTNWRYYDDLWYEARFASHPLGPDTVFAKGETPALAICRAALLALDAERELVSRALSSEERAP